MPTRLPELGPDYPVTFRAEIVKPIINLIQSGESVTVAGAASMGKSRLLQFLLRRDVQEHYLGEAAEHTLFAWVDCNRLAEISQWGLYELMLTALIEELATETRPLYLAQREKVILSQNALLAQRTVEMLLRTLCHEQGLRVVLVLDEFDECYSELPSQALANLRALRDMNKYWLCYLLFMRDDPAELRPPDECEGLYELVSRSVIGLTPHIQQDTRQIISLLMHRRQHELGDLPEESEEQLVVLSGGHPGFLVALIDSLIDEQPMYQTWSQWAQGLSKIQEECRKIWQGLRREEQNTLRHQTQNITTSVRERQSLILKGLLQDRGRGNITLFSPLFHHYVANLATFEGQVLHVDTVARSVYVEGQPPLKLTAREYELLAYLHEHLGMVRSNEDIISALYPGQQRFAINDSTIAALVRRLRKKIEIDPANPRYLRNERGRGYRLVTDDVDESMMQE